MTLIGIYLWLVENGYGPNFYFGLKKSAKKLHQTGNEIILSLYDRISTNKNASVNQQAKLGVCCPDPEGRNTVHFLAFDGRNK